jgi:hypothetical protein
MSHLRDARLRRALESAPDEHLLPGEQTREAIRAAARQAVAPPRPTAGRWSKLWQSLGERHMPWNAALATVAVATLVTVLWREREIPRARPDGAQPDQPASPPAAAPPPVPAAPAGQPPTVSSPPRAPVATAPPPAAAPARKAAPVAKLESQSRPQPQLQPVPQPQPPPPSAQPRAEPAPAASERRAEATVDAFRDRSIRDLAKSAPPPQSAEASKQAEVGTAAGAPAPAAPAAMPRAAPSGLASQRAAPVGQSWTHLRIGASGRVVELTREQAPRLAQLLEELRSAAQGQAPLEGPVEIRIELTRAGEPAGIIELAGTQLRWKPVGAAAGGSFTARPELAQLEALRGEIGRLLR